MDNFIEWVPGWRRVKNPPALNDGPTFVDFIARRLAKSDVEIVDDIIVVVDSDNNAAEIISGWSALFDDSTLFLPTVDADVFDTLELKDIFWRSFWNTFLLKNM